MRKINNDNTNNNNDNNNTGLAVTQTRVENDQLTQMWKNSQGVK